MTAIVVFIIFVAVQFIAGLGALLFSNLDKLGSNVPIDQLSISPVATGISLLVVEGLYALGMWFWFYRFEYKVRTKAQERPELLSIFKFHPLKRELAEHSMSPWRWFITVTLSVAYALLIAAVLEKCGLADDSSMQPFEGMLHNPLCLLLLCVVGPLCEELVFRVGILRSLYRFNVPGWLAAIISALAFAVVHGNLAQGIPAFIMGFVFGMAYLRTGNLRLCLPMHMVNNTLSVILYNSPISSNNSWWYFAIISLFYTCWLFENLSIPQEKKI